METGNSREGRGRAVVGLRWRGRARSVRRPTLSLYFSARPSRYCFPIEGFGACIRSRKTGVLWRINCVGVLSFKSESVSNRR